MTTTKKSKKHSQKHETTHHHHVTKKTVKKKTKSHRNVLVRAAVSQTPVKTSRDHLDLKTCQEVEIGDIGGFGDVQELEHHQKQCGDTAIEYCMSCGKHLCRIHYMLLHGDHDSHTNNRSASLA